MMYRLLPVLKNKAPAYAQKLSIWCLLFFLAALAGCAAAPSQNRQHIENSRVFKAPFDMVWESLVEVIGTSGDFITMAAKDSGVISFQRALLLDEIETFGYNETGLLWTQGTANVVVILKREDETRTLLTINARIVGIGRTATDVILSRTRQLNLTSQGVLEKKYFDLLNEKLLEKIKLIKELQPS
ncbi:MAG: hypothetical protein WCQ99_01375 [Pseudomonadota bacterium]